MTKEKLRDLSRLLQPRSIAVVGGGIWGQQVVRQSKLMGFSGPIFRVHPDEDTVEGIVAVKSIEDLPQVPDAVFLGINRKASVDAISVLYRMGAGGAVCFASGFSEASSEDEFSADLQDQLVHAAGDMPILGPNCYGYINALDGALLWPDQHGCQLVERGVAIITQSSNIAINLTMQQRALPIASVVTCGNMAQTSQAEIAMSLLEDPRITAIGLYVEGFADTTAWHRLAQKAWVAGKPLIVLKAGVSEQARASSVSHTAALAGTDVGAMAFLDYLGIPRVYDLPALLSALMVAHCTGGLPSNALSSISCSGGEAALVADLGSTKKLSFPPLSEQQKVALRDALGSMVSLSNPLDYHTYIWGDLDKMTKAWLPMASDHIAVVLVILDYPTTDPSAWESATLAAIEVHRLTQKPVAVVSTMPELLPSETAERLLSEGVMPLPGLSDALSALEALALRKAPKPMVPTKNKRKRMEKMLEEREAKDNLNSAGIPVPRGVILAPFKDEANELDKVTPPFAVKCLNMAHKSDHGGVRLNVGIDDLEACCRDMPCDRFLVEEMVEKGVAELLVGITDDPAHGFILTVAAGGVLTELMQDRVSLLLPGSREDVSMALAKLNVFALLDGYRGRDKANIDAVVDVVLALQDFVLVHSDGICEAEINPLICTPNSAIAADALISVTSEFDPKVTK